MDDYQAAPAAEPAVIRVKFGPADHQEIRLEVAEYILMAWREKSEKQFGDALRDALLSTNGGRS